MTFGTSRASEESAHNSPHGPNGLTTDRQTDTPLGPPPGPPRNQYVAHGILALGNPGCSQRWEHRVSDVCAPSVLDNTP
eukprot:6893474-Pyramimonas_sp.AAC.1